MMGNKLPNRIHTDELRAALEDVLAQRVKSLHRRLSNYSSSYTIETLDVELARGPKLRLVLKDLSPAALLSTAQKVRPRFLYNPQREIFTYQKVLNRARLGTACCHGAMNAPVLERHWLFLERVDGPLLWQVGNLDKWDDAARWLAMLHHKSPSPAARGPARNSPLLRYDERFFAVWLTRAEEFLGLQRGHQSPTARKRFARLASRYDRVVKRLTSLPVTFIHGEFYPSNVILRHGADGSQPVCPVDWEVAGIGPGLLDLAALTAGDWNDAEKRRFVAAYREGNSTRDSLDDLVEGVEFCQLHLAMQLLGWATDWTPPEQHAQNWLATALRLADKLGL